MEINLEKTYKQIKQNQKNIQKPKKISRNLKLKLALALPVLALTHTHTRTHAREREKRDRKKRAKKKIGAFEYISASFPLTTTLT